jgi:hypothetical protein
MAIVNQQVASELQSTGGQLPIMQAPVPIPSEGRPAIGPCKWYERPVYTDTQGTIYEVPLGCANNSTLIGGLVAALSLAGWFLYRKVK